MAKSQITVNTLAELKPYLNQDNVDIKLATGTYTIAASDVSSGDWGYVPHPKIGYAKSIMLFEGSNSTYDFTDATILFNTDLFSIFGSVDVWEVHIVGNDNTLKGLTMIDDGSVDDAPRKGAVNVVIDGKNNRVENFNVTAKGSFPYAYGDAFGKGSGSLISHQKHSGILIRGSYNTLSNSTLIQRAYGHCVFMQGADHPTIEGCYIEGEMRSTDDMLAEQGTGSPADEIDFMTVYGYTLPSGFMKALCEEGIRSYNAGETIIDGVYYVERGSNDITVKDNIVKNARGGCSIVLSSGTNHVENVSILGCEFGFTVGSNKLINCSADCVYGAAYMNAYDTQRNTVSGDLTILPPSDDYYNGGGVAAFFGGEGATLHLHNEGGELGEGLVIRIGGNTGNVAHLESEDHTAGGNTIINHTGYPIIVTSESNNNDISTCSTVTDNGSNNLTTYFTDCESENICDNTLDNLQAECFDSMAGIDTEASDDEDETYDVSWIQNGDWLAYGSIDLAGMYSIQARVATDKTEGIIEVRLDAADGTLIASIPVNSTGGFQSWATENSSIIETEGQHDIYFVFVGDEGYLYNVNWFAFSEDFICDIPSLDRIEAECFIEASELGMEPCIEGTKQITPLDNGDWAMYSGIDLTDQKSIKVRNSNTDIGGAIEVRIDALDGDLIASLELETTENWKIDSVNIEQTIGVHDVYLVFTGGDGNSLNINYFEFSEDEFILLNTKNDINSNIIIYPNPTTGLIQFSVESEYQIFNALGRTVKKGFGNSINISDQPMGIYFVKTNSLGQRRIQKVVKR